MKRFRRQFKTISLLLSLLTLFQSCRVYHRDSVTLDHAVKQEKRVKIKTIDNKTLKFKKLIYEEGKYFGIKPSTFMDTVYKVPLDQSKLQNIRLHNKALSIVYGISITIITSLVLAYIIVLSSFDLDLDFGGFSAPM